MLSWDPPVGASLSVPALLCLPVYCHFLKLNKRNVRRQLVFAVSYPLLRSYKPGKISIFRKRFSCTRFFKVNLLTEKGLGRESKDSEILPVKMLNE